MGLSGDEIKRLGELAEAHAALDLFKAAPAELVAELGLSFEETAAFAAFQVKNNSPLQFYNMILALGVGAPVTQDDLNRLLNLYREANLSFKIQLSPEAQPPELPQWLEAHGLQHEGNSAKFYRNVETLPELSTDFHIEAVGVERAADFARIASSGGGKTLELWLMKIVGRDNWQLYLAFNEENIPVAAGALYLDGPIGWFGWGATLPEYRRRGAQSALLAYRIREAARLGCQWLSVDTGENTPEKPNSSYHNILRAGFQLAYLRPNYKYKVTE